MHPVFCYSFSLCCESIINILMQDIFLVTGPTGKSVLDFWNFIHYAGAGFRWCTTACSVENPTFCNDGIIKSSCIPGRLLIFNYEARSNTVYKEGVVCSEHSCLLNLYCKLLLSLLGAPFASY